MTVRVPMWLQGGSHPAEDVRLQEFNDVLSAGVVGTGDLQVAAQGTPNMSVQVAAGGAYIAGSQSANQGLYKSRNDASVTLTIAASDPTNPRIDLVVLKVQDAFYSGGTNSASLAVVTGTPAASPSAPAAPANSITLAQVRVNATTTSVTNANITDQRTFHRKRSATFQADSASTAALTLLAASGQSGNVLQLQDYTGTPLCAFGSTGVFYGDMIQVGSQGTDFKGVYWYNVSGLPGTPPSGQGWLYLNSGSLYFRGSSGVDRLIASA